VRLKVSGIEYIEAIAAAHAAGRKMAAFLTNDDVILMLAFLHVLPIPASTIDRLLDLLRRHPVTGGDVFDLQIVATMQANGVERIYTFNTADFGAFPELSIVTP
jgi:predicted nucleic acid-binding protein